MNSVPLGRFTSGHFVQHLTIDGPRPDGPRPDGWTLESQSIWIEISYMYCKLMYILSLLSNRPKIDVKIE